jgi:uncharacterized membrane protein YfcA
MRMGRIDYRFGTLFTLASLPGAVLGVLLVGEVSRGFFDKFFGVLLIVLGCLLFASPLRQSGAGTAAVTSTDHQALPGAIGSAYIAALSSLLGIGGGIIHVPFLVRVLGMAPHAATATSHFVLTFMAFTATATHVILGEFDRGLSETMYLAVGVMMGAPIGAGLSSRMKGSVMVRLLALGLCVVGLRLLIGALN